MWRPPRQFNVLVRLITKSPREGGVGLEYLHQKWGKPRCAGTSFDLFSSACSTNTKKTADDRVALHSSTQPQYSQHLVHFYSEFKSSRFTEYCNALTSLVTILPLRNPLYRSIKKSDKVKLYLLQQKKSTGLY